MEDIEILLQRTVVEGDNLHKVLDEGKLRCEVRQRNDAEVLLLTCSVTRTHRKRIRNHSSLNKFLL